MSVSDRFLSKLFENICRFFFLEKYARESSYLKLVVLVFLMNVLDAVLTYFGNSPYFLSLNGTYNEGNAPFLAVMEYAGPLAAMYLKLLLAATILFFIYLYYTRGSDSKQEMYRYVFVVLVLLYGLFACVPWACLMFFQFVIELVSHLKHIGQLEAHTSSTYIYNIKLLRFETAYIYFYGLWLLIPLSHYHLYVWVFDKDKKAM